MKVIRKYMAGQPDPNDKLGIQILHRRALFCSELANLGLWPNSEKDDPPAKDISLV